jgi:chemotaxis protein MotB
MKAVTKTRQSHEEEHYWPSFTDVMSSLVFVLFFFIVILLIKQIFSFQTYDAKLNQAKNQLTRQQSQLSMTHQDLSRAQEELREKSQTLAELEASLNEREARINQLEGQLSQDQQALYLKEQELAEVKGKLEEISVLRLSLLKEVKASIEAELAKTLSTSSESLVTIDDKANLVIQSSLLFAKGSSEISPSGRAMLRQFALAFENILSKPSVRENIDSITISGYADSDDTYENNYFLSCERAIAVITAMMQENPVLEKNYGSFFQASGFSEFRPLVKEVNEAAKAKNRRIQIAIHIKDANIQRIINDYMNKQP